MHETRSKSMISRGSTRSGTGAILLPNALGMTFIEMMMGITIMMIVAAILLPVLARGREAANRTHCMNNLKQMGYAFLMISGENDGAFPPGTPNHFWGEPGTAPDSQRLIRNNYICDVRAIYPDYIDELKSFTCRSTRWPERMGLPSEDYLYHDMTFSALNGSATVLQNPANLSVLDQVRGARPDVECLTNQMYTYLPYAAITEEQGLFLFTALDQLMSQGVIDMMQGDITIPGGHAPGNSDVFHRLRVGVEKYFISDVNRPEASAQSSSRIPVLYDSVSFNGQVDLNHIVPLGGNVLYMDGHAKFERFFTVNDRIPYTALFMEWTSRNVFTNDPLMNVPPWCSNRVPGTPFEPRYKYYPNDPLYQGLVL